MFKLLTIFGSLFLAFIMFAVHAIAAGIFFLAVAALGVRFFVMEGRKEREEDEIRQAQLREIRRQGSARK